MIINKKAQYAATYWAPRFPSKDGITTKLLYRKKYYLIINNNELRFVLLRNGIITNLSQ